MDKEPKEIESRFLGHKFAPGDRVRLADIEHHGYDNDPQFQGVNLRGTFTIKSVEPQHRPDTGEQDDLGDYDYQIVELAEIPFRAANDNLS